MLERKHRQIKASCACVGGLADLPLQFSTKLLSATGFARQVNIPAGALSVAHLATKAAVWRGIQGMRPAIRP